MAKKTTVLAYVRESSASETEQAQIKAIQKYCDAHNMKPEFYFDSSLEFEMEHDAFRKVQSAISKDNKSIVICFSLDRLSTSLSGCLGIIQTWLGLGVRIISTSEELELGEENVELIYPFLSSIIKMDTQLLRDKRAVGIAKAKAEGKYKGRKEGTTKAKYMKAWDLYERGLTMEQVGESMGVSHRTATRYIDRTRAEWVMEDFMTAVWLVSKEKGIKAEAVTRKDDQKNPKYPSLGYAWKDETNDEVKVNEVPKELVKLIVQKFTADSPEARLVTRARLLDLVRGLDSTDWVLLKALEPPTITQASDDEPQLEWHSRKTRFIGEFEMPKDFSWAKEDFFQAEGIALVRELLIKDLHLWRQGKETDDYILERFGKDVSTALLKSDEFKLAKLLTGESILKNHGSFIKSLLSGIK